VKPPAWTSEEDERLRKLYPQVKYPLIAEVLGRTVNSVRSRLHRLGISENRSWTELEESYLREAYGVGKLKGELNLKALAADLGRDVSAVCLKARRMGLTDNARKGVKKPPVDRRKYKSEEELKAARSERMRKRHEERGHPMSGKKHGAEALEKIAQASRRSWATATKAERAQRTESMMKARINSAGKIAQNRPHGSWKAGWREIGGKRNYYRSRWEANYARYLEWLKANGSIVDWQHEPETFWFEGIKRGVRSYLPDFRLWLPCGSTELHEVKGWMDARSKTAIARMGRYHPGEKLIVIREKQYNAIARSHADLIADWEQSNRSDRL